MQWLWRLLEWWRAYRLEVIAAKAKAKNAQFEAILAVATAQSEFMQKWLDSFKITDIPTSSVMRDEDVVKEELDRLYNERLNSGNPDIAAEVLADIQDSIRTGKIFPPLQ